LISYYNKKSISLLFKSPIDPIRKVFYFVNFPG